MQYFNHDTTASDDDSVMALRLEHGGAAVDAYWSLLEKIYREERAVIIDENQPETKSVSYRLAIGCDVLTKYVDSMISLGLLARDENDPTQVFSVRAMENIERYHAKAETARQNGKKGGRKPTQKPNPNRTANQVGTKNQANKIKENKSIGFDKTKPNTLANAPDATAAGAASVGSQGICPDCGAVTYRKTMNGETSWYCPSCNEAKAGTIPYCAPCPDTLKKAVIG